MDLLKRMGFKNVQETHRYGAPEYGKDIIASFAHELDDIEWYAFVVKKGRILGGTDIIENVKNQIKQCFEYPYESVEGNEVKINKVRVVNSENITRGATDAIGKSPELKSYST